MFRARLQNLTLLLMLNFAGFLTALEWMRERSGKEEVNLVGLGMAGVWSYFARAMSDEKVNLAADLVHFKTDNDNEYLHRFFVPGLRRAGDFRAGAVLLAGGEVLLQNTGPEFPTDWLKASFLAAGAKADVAPESQLLGWIAPELRKLSCKAKRPAGEK